MAIEVKHIFKNKVLVYLGGRYVTYFIQFANTIVISALLGPYYLGVWGFLNLVVQYFTQLNFGIPHSANTVFSIERHDVERVTNAFNTAFVILGLLSMTIGVIIFLPQLLNFEVGRKYLFSNYSGFVFLLIVSNYFNMLFVNAYRVFGRLREIAFSQSVTPLIMLISTFFFRDIKLLEALVYSNIIGAVLSFALFCRNTPIKIRLKLNPALSRELSKKGLFLFLYNASFYLVLISSRFIISSYYPVSDFGMLTFSYSLSNIVTLFLDSIGFLLFPKIINAYAKSNDVGLLKLIRSNYILIASSIVYLLLLAMPVFLIMFPKYQGALASFRILALISLVYSLSFGYQNVLIGKGKERTLGFTALVFLGLNFGCCLMGAISGMRFEFILLTTFMIYCGYVYLILFLGRGIILVRNSLMAVLSDQDTFKQIFPLATAVLLVVLEVNDLMYFLPLLLFLVMNYKKISSLKSVADQLVKRPDIIDIK